MPEDVATPIETDDDRDVYGRIGVRRRRRRPPAGPQPRKQILEVVDLVQLGLGRRDPRRQQQRRGKPKESFSMQRRHASAIPAHLMSEATCTFTILSGSVTAPPADPGGAFFSLSTTSMPDTNSPITVYWLSRRGPCANVMRHCE